MEHLKNTVQQYIVHVWKSNEYMMECLMNKNTTEQYHNIK